MKVRDICNMPTSICTAEITAKGIHEVAIPLVSLLLSMVL